MGCVLVEKADADLGDSWRPSMGLLVAGRIMAFGDVGKHPKCLLSGLIRGEGAVLAQCQPTCMPILAILNQIGLDAAWHHAQPEAWQRIVKEEIVRLPRTSGVHNAFGELGH